MRRVRSVIQILIAAALLAACAPAVPAPTAVPTHTATLAPTLTPTLTLVPTATEIPTASPTPTATPEDFSDLPYAKTFKEAAVMEGTVTREDIESGRLRAFAATLDVESSGESISSLKINIEEHSFSPGIASLSFNSAEGVKIIAVFPYVNKWGYKKVIAIESIPTTKGRGSLTFAFPVDSSKIGQMLLGQLNDQEVITPYYESPASLDLTKEVKRIIDMGSSFSYDVDQTWIEDLPKVQALMRQWEETGEFPEELSDYVLQPLPME